MQHVAVQVEDLGRLAEDLRVAGLEFDTSVIEGTGLRQIFTKRDQGSGLMIEFIERSTSGFSDQNVSALFAQLEEKDSF